MNKRIKTAAYRLFHFRYRVMIPSMYMYGKAYIEKVGYPQTGDAKLDAERLTVPSLMLHTPAAMAMLYAEGAPMERAFVDRADTVPIYLDIQEHLLDWERAIMSGLHSSDLPPLTDFRQLEALAMLIYQSAKYYQPDEPTTSALRDAIMSMNRRRNPAQTDIYIRSKIIDDKKELKPYVSIVDRIEALLVGGALWL